MMEKIPTRDWDSKEERNAQGVRMTPAPAVVPTASKATTIPTYRAPVNGPAALGSPIHDANSYRKPISIPTAVGSTPHDANTARAPINGPAPLVSVGQSQGPLNQPRGTMASSAGQPPASAPRTAPAAPQAVLPIAPPAGRPATMGDLNGAVSRINEQLATLKEQQMQRDDLSGMGMYKTPDVPSMVYNSRGFPFGAEHPWGLVSVSGASVTIAGGEFESGNGAVLATSQQTLTITTDASYIGIQYNPANGLSLITPNTAKPVSGGGVFQTWLYFFAFDGTNASYVRHNLTGSWHAALFAAYTS